MEKRRVRGKQESGQILPLVALMMIAIVAMVALIIDGGFLMSNKRTAQAAADAGAMAGAKQLCVGEDEGVAKTAVDNYVVANNAVVVPPIEVDVENKIVKVTVEIVKSSFFAGIFGDDSLTARAHAAAKCLPPNTGKYLMPIAWACRPPVDGIPSESEDCQMKALDYQTEFLPLTSKNVGSVTINGVEYQTPFDFSKDYLPQIYIVMDSVSQKSTSSDVNDLTNVCKPTGYMNCDINGDGSPDILSAGDRGWLSFDGTNDANSLKNWIENGYDQPLKIHTWLPADNAERGSVFASIKTKVGKLVLLPVYNAICLGDPSGSSNPCQEYAHSLIDLKPGETETVVLGNGTSTQYYHIISFSAFYITCVNENGGKDKCPGHQAAVDSGLIAKNDKTVEGYFVFGYPDEALSNPGEGEADTGVYVISLIE